MKKTNEVKEVEFLQRLEQKAEEQKKIAGTEILPDWARGIGEWLVIHPWRVLVPIAGIAYLALRITGGTKFRELILAIFGGF